MLIRYARVSTVEQNLDLQIDALKDAGCKKIITDTEYTGCRLTERRNLRAMDLIGIKLTVSCIYGLIS